MTEFYASGAYAVTRCKPNGELEISQTVAPIDFRGVIALNMVRRVDRDPSGLDRAVDVLIGTPPEDAPLQRQDEPLPGTPAPPALITQELERVVGGRPVVVGPGNDLLAPTATARVARANRGIARARAAQADDTCTNAEFNFSGPAWLDQRYAYVARVSSMPHGDSDREVITRGHHAWDFTENPCGFNDITNFVSDYFGETSETAHTTCDRVNVVDFGDLSPWSVPRASIALTTTCSSQTTGFFTQNDQRYEQPPDGPSGTFRWSHDGAPDSWDLWDSATHESGHSLGLAHAFSSAGNWLAMSPFSSRGSIRKRDLGRGDVLGLRARYP